MRLRFTLFASSLALLIGCGGGTYSGTGEFQPGDDASTGTATTSDDSGGGDAIFPGTDGSGDDSTIGDDSASDATTTTPSDAATDATSVTVSDSAASDSAPSDSAASDSAASDSAASDSAASDSAASDSAASDSAASDSAASDSAASDSAASDSGGTDTGPTGTPGLVLCFDSDTGKTVECTTSDGCHGGYDVTKFSWHWQCGGFWWGSRTYSCDDATDCSGKKCCTSKDIGGNVNGSSCQSSCGGDLQLCLLDSECGGGKKCKPFSPPDLSVTFGACQ